jgi:RimJ/RimL family protein N-acetyltransferase
MSDAWIAELSDPDRWTPPKTLPVVEVDYLVIRAYRKGDGPKLFAAVDDQRDKLLPWMSWCRTDHLSEDDSIHYVERFRRETEKPDCLNFPLGIFDRRDGSVVGGTGFHRLHPEYRDAEIGYWIRGSHQGLGLCTRAIGALMSAGFRAQDAGGWGFRRITIFMSATNTASRRVCEKLGLRLEMRMKAERYQVGYKDTFGFAALADEWDFEQHKAKPNIAWPD